MDFELKETKQSNKMTTEEKLIAVRDSPEMIAAMKVLVAAFNDCDLQSFIRFYYPTNDGKVHEITYIPIKHRISRTGEDNQSK